MKATTTKKARTKKARTKKTKKPEAKQCYWCDEVKNEEMLKARAGYLCARCFAFMRAERQTMGETLHGQLWISGGVIKGGGG